MSKNLNLSSKLMTLKLLPIILILISSTIFAGCSRHKGIEVVIHNIGDNPIESVVVHVTGNSYPIGKFNSGERKTVYVEPTGESHIELEVESKTGEKKRLKVDCYMEPGYKGDIYIETDGNSVSGVVNNIRI